MTQAEKTLQLIDLCARLPYNTKIAYCTPDNTEVVTLSLATIKIIEAIHVYTDCPISVKPYLRPMSCIAELISAKEWSSLGGIELIDWYNANHIDYRGLIEKGLALEAPEGMYNIN